ncbi:hypothetical protein N7536_000125 [Penicillium majusculum]|nr:hypothetical protein N7536_000125 [Penicillium majusculum]
MLLLNGGQNKPGHMDTLKLIPLSGLGNFKIYQRALQDGHTYELRPHILESWGEDSGKRISWIDVIC